MIPKIIWQTYKYEYKKLPQDILNLTKTWIDMNQEYEYRYFDDKMLENFVLSEYGKEWHNIILNCPIPVMKADIWRYLIIQKYGGVYVDIDTECLNPLKSWIDDSYDFIVCDDSSSFELAQLAFAASPNTEIMNNVLLSIKNTINKIDLSDNLYIEKTTGTDIWTTSIRKFLKIQQHLNPSKDFNQINNSIEAKKHKFFCYGETEIESPGVVKFFNGNIRHFTASANWAFSGYNSWQEQLKDIKNDRKI
jgi:hypothetical protein